MIRILVLAAFLVVGGSEKTKSPVKKAEVKSDDAKSEPSTLEAALNSDYLGLDADRLRELEGNRDIELDLTAEEKKVVQDFYSPDYYEPNIILDYRYLKSGGRGYARSDGGQILILPKRDQSPVLYNNYDTLIEYLRLKHLEETNKNWNEVYGNEHEYKRRGSQLYTNIIDEYGEEKNRYRSKAENSWATYNH